MDGEDYDACNLHAFCSACTENGGKDMNSNCKSMVREQISGCASRLSGFNVLCVER